MQAADVEPVAGGDRLHVGEVLVPDAEARAGSTGVRPVRRAAAEPGIHAHADVGARKSPAVLLELMARARIEEDAALDEGSQAPRRHLRRQLDSIGRRPHTERALHFMVARRVDVEAQGQEAPQDRGARIRLHGVADGQTEGIREGERPRCRGVERGLIVHVAGRPEAIANLRRLCRREEHSELLSRLLGLTPVRPVRTAPRRAASSPAPRSAQCATSSRSRRTPPTPSGDRR